MTRSAGWARITPWRIFVAVFVVYAYFMPQWADWNIDSRLDLVHALVVDHTVRIDRYHWNTWDKAFYRGHYYSDKAPGTAVLGAVMFGGFLALKSAPLSGGIIRDIETNDAWSVPIQLGLSATQKQPAAKGTVLGGCQRTGVAGNVQYIPWGNRLYPPFQDWALSKYVVTIGVDGLISALFAAFLFWFLGFFVSSIPLRFLLTTLYALATTALPYSSNFYSHQLSAAFLFTAFALLYLRGRGRVGNWSVPASGFLLGFSVFTEYTVLPIAAAIGLYGLWQLRSQAPTIAPFVVAGLVPIGGLLVYNYACFGNALDTGYAHDFCWSAAQGAGIAGFTYPKPWPLFDLSFGEFRGLFFLSPFLLLAAPGAFVMARRKLGLEAALCLAIGVLFIVLLSAYWGWNGGRVDGPRYLVPAIPFLAFPVLFVLDAGFHRPAVRIAVAVLAIWSVGAVWIEFLSGPTFPTSWLPRPITQFSLPALEANHITSNAGFFLGLRGWESLVPLAVLLAIWTAVVTLNPSKAFWVEILRGLVYGGT